MHVTLTSPTVGLTAVYPCATPTGPGDTRWRHYRHGVKSAPAHARNRGLNSDRKSRGRPIRYPQQRPSVPVATRISLDDVVSMAEHAREVASLQSRRTVLEEAHRALRSEGLFDRSRPHSVIGPGLQSLTSPMPSPSRAGQVDHIPSLLPLPSDRTFIPSPDQNHDRHVTNTPAEQFRLEDDNTHHPVARQCCEIMGPSLCRSCRRLESRAQNRKSAELECPRMRSAGGRSRQTFSLTQVVKRSYPRLSDAEIQDKLARGEIARLSFPWVPRSGRYDDSDSEDMRNINSCYSGRTSASDKDQDDEEEDQDILHIDPGTYRANTPSSRPDSCTIKYDMEGSTNTIPDCAEDTMTGTPGVRQQLTKASLSTKNAFYFLAKLTMKLQGSTTTPLFFSDLRGMQSKILSGAVDRKAYMTLRPEVVGQRGNQQNPHSRLKSAVSTASTSSGKSGLSKLGSQLSRDFMPAFVSPRRVKLIEEPKYKVYFEPPLLTKRRQIPNPSFFAGSNDEYSLPERLPDVIEFADSQRIAAMEKQIRSGSALSFVSSVSDEQHLQTSVGHQEKITSLPLDKECDSAGRERVGGDSRPASGRGSVGERNVSTPTPRSTMRVSSGGPLGSRTVPEENEEDVRRETEEDGQSIKENREREGDVENESRLSTVHENVNTNEASNGGQGPASEGNGELEQDFPLELDAFEVTGTKERQGDETNNAGSLADAEERFFHDSLVLKENVELRSESELVEQELAPIIEEPGGGGKNNGSHFFLTNRESTEELECHAEEHQGPQANHAIERTTEAYNHTETSDCKTWGTYHLTYDSDHSVHDANDDLDRSGHNDESGSDEKWWRQ